MNFPGGRCPSPIIRPPEIAFSTRSERTFTFLLTGEETGGAFAQGNLGGQFKDTKAIAVGPFGDVYGADTSVGSDVFWKDARAIVEQLFAAQGLL